MLSESNKAVMNSKKDPTLSTIEMIPIYIQRKLTTRKNIVPSSVTLSLGPNPYQVAPSSFDSVHSPTISELSQAHCKIRDLGCRILVAEPMVTIKVTEKCIIIRCVLMLA